MDYLEFELKISPIEPWRDILVAELGEIDFESFIETENGITAYIQTELFNEVNFNAIATFSNDFCEISYSKNNVVPQNWNKEWEKNFSPINVDDKCVIRAPFHSKTDADYEIIIEPKMSFGTGHHETTHMMTQYILSIDVSDKCVMDMGCGTGILAILAAKKGAAIVDAVDIDEWSFENTIENKQRNGVDFINVYKSDASFLAENSKYDLFIANINRNILIRDLEKYSDSIKNDGSLLLSGFYVNDISQLEIEAKKHNFVLKEKREKNNWAALRFTKN